MLSVTQSAELLQVSSARVRALIRDGLLPKRRHASSGPISRRGFILYGRF